MLASGSQACSITPDIHLDLRESNLDKAIMHLRHR